MAELEVISWIDEGETRSALWRSERSAAPPSEMVVVDDRLTADEAFGLAGQNIGLLWRGDFQNARQLLTALAARADQVPKKAKRRKTPPAAPASMRDAFNLERQARSRRARMLGALLVPLEADFSIPLRRAPDWRQACLEAYGSAEGLSVVSLRELVGVNSAHEWRKNGIDVPALKGRIHPFYGVFAPIRSEYVDLVAQAPLPKTLEANSLAFDIGTGTGVLAAVLARRGVQRVVATDMDPRALACAQENVTRLGLAAHVEVVKADLFPPGQAPLIVCNPPWVPARPSSPLENGIYDAESRMLKGFLQGLAAHLEPAGEGWLLLSDLAEHLGLRSREELLAWIDGGNLKVIDTTTVRPRHPRAADASDPLHAARNAEKTSLWRLAAK